VFTAEAAIATLFSLILLVSAGGELYVTSMQDIVSFRMAVCSPSDVAKEREIVRKIVEDIDRNSISHGRHLHLVCWEKDAHPALDPLGPIGVRLRGFRDSGGTFGARLGTVVAPSCMRRHVDVSCGASVAVHAGRRQEAEESSRDGWCRSWEVPAQSAPERTGCHCVVLLDETTPNGIRQDKDESAEAPRAPWR
jgi:hypothetical protein